MQCTNERELAREFDSIQRTLSDQRGDWNNRMSALKRLQALSLGSSQLGQFAQLCMRLREPLVSQVQDLRSAIVREACSVLYILVHALGAECEPLALAALPALFKITFVAILVVAESGYQCICAIVSQCRTARVVGILIEQMNNRNGTVRWRSAQALLLALQTYPTSTLERHVDALEGVVRQCLEDARDDVRAYGRRCFWAFRSVFEERGQRLFARLDGTKQKLLESDRPTVQESSLAPDESHDIGLAMSLNANFDAVKETPSSSPSSRVPVSTQGVSSDMSTAATESEVSAKRSVPPRPQHGRLQAASLSIQAKSGPSSSRRSLATREASAPTRSSSVDSKVNVSSSSAELTRKQPPPLSGSAIPGPPSMLSHFSPPASPSSASASPSPSKIPTPTISVSSSFPHRKSREEAQVPEAVPSPASSSTSVPSSVAPSVSGGRAEGFRPPPRAHSGVSPSSARAASVEVPTKASVTSAAKPMAKDQATADFTRCAPARLCYLARSATSPAPCAAALSHLAERLQSPGDDGNVIQGTLTDPTPLQVEEAIEVALSRLYDVPSVTSAAFSVLRALLISRPVPCSQHLDRILAALLAITSTANSASGNAGTQAAARSALALIVERQPPSSLLAAMGSLLAGDCSWPGGRPCTEPTRLAALDLLEKRVAELPAIVDHLAGRSSQLATGASSEKASENGVCSDSTSAMQRLIEDLLRCSGSWPPPPQGSAASVSATVRRAVARSLNALCLRQTPAFMGAVAALHPQPRDALTALLGHFFPELSEQLAKYTSSSRVGQQQALGQLPNNTSATPTPPTQPPLWAGSIEGVKRQQHTDYLTPVWAREGNREAENSPPQPTIDSSMGSRSGQTKQPAISVLLTHCGPQTQRATLRALALAAKTEGRQAWEKHFGRVLILVLDSLTQPEAQGVRDTAILCLQELVVHQPSFFNDFAEVVASKLFEAYRSCSQADKQTITSIDRTLERLIGVVEATRGLEILLPVVRSEGPPLLQAATRLLSSVLQRMPPQRVLENLNVVLPGVVQAFGNPSSEVRKAAVFCLVDVYMILGEQVMPYLVKDLTPSQMKLVTIYIGRQQREREELGIEEEHGND